MTVVINGWAYAWDDDRPRRRLIPAMREQFEYELNKNVADSMVRKFKIELQSNLKSESDRKSRARKKVKEQ